MRIVLDTNVLVSALLRSEGKPARILDLALEGSLRLIVDARIFDEYEEVLARPRFAIAPQRRDPILEWIRQRAEWLGPVPPARAPLPDPDDAPFLEVAQAGIADALVTGNSAHFPREVWGGVRVLNPAQFVVFWEQREAD